MDCNSNSSVRKKIREKSKKKGSYKLSEDVLNNDEPIFQINDSDDINQILASCAESGQKLLIPLNDGCFLDIRSSNDNQRHLIMLKKPVVDESEIIACDGFFGFSHKGDIIETLWSYRNEINEFYRKQ